MSDSQTTNIRKNCPIHFFYMFDLKDKNKKNKNIFLKN